MKRILISFLVFVTVCTVSQAASVVRSIDIEVNLALDGTAHIVEIWDTDSESGTEIYLVRDNLEDIEILNLAVSDEYGSPYLFEPVWDVDRSLSEKAGRCGIVRRKNGGCEICWGIGSYGEHVYTVSYDMTNAVKSINDCDILHLQLVSPGINATIGRVEVTINIPENQLEGDPVKAWGFGFNGQVEVSREAVSMWSGPSFGPESSVIALLRFDKGIFHSASIRNMDFDDVRKRAFEGSDYESDDASLVDLLVAVVGCFVAIIGVSVLMSRRRKKKVFGTASLSDIQWSRDVPFDGDILKCDYILDRADNSRKSNTVASAMILRMLEHSNLSTGSDQKGRLEIHFNDSASDEWMSELEKQLYDMMKTASGKDIILQNREFSRWSALHTKTVSAWAENVKKASSSALSSSGVMNPAGRFTSEGQRKAREVIGFRKFLSDFTLASERRSSEVGLWKDYLVFAALFGIADQVAKELKDIDPKILSEALPCYNPYMYSDLLRMSSRLADSITSATLSAKAEAMRAAGMGGRTSFGGGGGFSGGGFGGGFR